MTVRIIEDKETWDSYVLEHNGHPLQLWGWGAVKAAHNWQVERVLIEEDGVTLGGAQLQIRPLPFPFRSLVYISRGPLLSSPLYQARVLEVLAHYAKQHHHAVTISVEPDWTTFPSLAGWRQTTNTILIPRTIILDLEQPEEQLQVEMTKKTRQYIRKSAKEAIEIRQVKTDAELAACLEIYHDTAKRAGFAIHSDAYYEDVFHELGEYSPIFAIFSREKVLAFLWLAISQETAFELYGGVNDEGQQLRVNYALKWHAIQTVKKWGITRYDLNGLLNDGIITFKQGFASHEDLLAGTYDKPLSPFYLLWKHGLPLIKKLIRTLHAR